MFVTFEEYFGVDDDKLNERFYGFEEYVMEKDLNDEKCHATFKIFTFSRFFIVAECIFLMVAKN